MPISTLKTGQNNTTATFFYIITILGISAAIYFAIQIITNASVLQKKSALSVDVYNTNADVYLNDAILGKTPFSTKEIKPGENKIKLKAGSREYNTQIDFIPNDKNYIHNVGIFADLGTSDTFSSVQEFWFEKDKSGNVARILSEPSGASVFIDNSEVGKTPYASDKLSDGEYDLRVDYPGYETHTARINIKKGYTLNVKFKMFPVPNPLSIKLLEGATDFYDLSTDNTAVSADTQNWVNAVIYWNRTRGLNVEGTGLNKEKVFDYFVDYKGNLFNNNGELVIGKEGMDALKGAKKSAYLGRTTDGAGLTKEAKDAVLSLSGIAIGSKKATILETGTGWLRVRSLAGLGGAEVAKVNVGQTYEVLEEATGWVKIKVSDTVSGWVSADYAKVQ